MFNNLIESSSHRSELKRRGSFFLFTTATYALLFVIAGVASIYAYDARLEDQSTEISILTFAPTNLPNEPVRQPVRGRQNPSRTNSAVSSQPTRPILYDRPDNPTNPPDNIGTIAPTIPPAPPGAIVGPTVTHPPGSGNPNDSGLGSNGRGDTTVINIEPAPPAPTPAPRIIKSSEILNGKALTLPKPMYSQMAKAMHIEGKVNVQVLIDEKGKVVSAKALDGPPLLRAACEKAAYQALFSPTLLSRQPVKVSGLITYNFVLQ
jgi:protein TonB